MKPTFSSFRKACLLYKTSKIVFSPSIFAIYNMGIYWVTGVTRGYKGLQGATKGLQGFTRGDTGLQGMTWGYKGLCKLFSN